MVDDQHLAGGARDRELFPVQLDFAQIGVVQCHGRAFASRDIVTSPEFAEAPTAQRELPDQLDEARVVHVGPHRLAKSGHQVSRRRRQVGVAVLFGRIQEQITHPVRAGDQPWGQRGGERVRGQHVEIPALDERGQRQGVQQQADSDGDGLLARPAS
jgi:hypothetical protein